MTFRIKLGAAFLTILLLLVLVAMISWWGMGSALDQQDRLYTFKSDLENKFHAMISEEQSFVTDELISHSQAVITILTEIKTSVGKEFNKTDDGENQKREQKVLQALIQYENSFNDFVEHTIGMQTMKSRMIQESKRMLANAHELEKIDAKSGTMQTLMSGVLLAEKGYMLQQENSGASEVNEKANQIVILAKSIQENTNRNVVKLTAFRIAKVAAIYRTSFNQFADELSKQRQALTLMRQSLINFDKELSSYIELESATSRNKVNFLKMFILITFFIAVLLSIVATYFLSGLISKPINQLKESAKMIIDGKLDASVNIAGNDEIGELGNIFNRMTQQLQKSFKDIQEYRDHLEDLVKERTLELKESEDKFRSIIESSPMGVFIWELSSDGKLIFSGYNPAADKILDTDNSQFLGREIDDAFPPLAETVLPQKFKEICETGIPWQTEQVDYEDEQIKGSFEIHAFRTSPRKMAIFFHDVTQRRQMQSDLALTAEILRKNENTLNSILVAAPVGIGLVHNRVFSWVSERIVEMTGYTADELIGESARILYPSEEEFLQVGKVKYDQLETNNVGETDTVWKKKSGELINIHLRSSPIDPQDLSLGVTFSALDITEKINREENVRLLEQQVQQAKNLDSLGVLAGGIAHDFNNILMAIMGNLSIATQSLPVDNKASSLLSEAEEACLRAKGLTQQLLTFSKGGEPIKETSNMAEVIKDSANFVLRGSSVACEYNIPQNLWLVDIDKGQISQVIQNLIINAKNAMPQGGTISVVCQNIEDISKENVPLPVGNKYIKMSITDRGVGISANILNKIFEPYFTTKQEGSGLGLAITFSIITKHQGHINAQSEVGVGTTFFIYLPASSQKPSAPCEEKSFVHSKKLTILIMDDEKMVRDVSAAMLTKLGHDYVMAADGDEAVKIFKQGQVPIDLVVMDLTIPGGMGGKDAVQKILAIDPKAKVIVSSGYSNDPIMAKFKDYGFCAAIVKPYRLDDLSRVISQVFD